MGRTATNDAGSAYLTYSVNVFGHPGTVYEHEDGNGILALSQPPDGGAHFVLGLGPHQGAERREENNAAKQNGLRAGVCG